MQRFRQDSALHENPGVKHTKATMAKQGSAWRFEVLFIGRLSTGGGDKKKKKTALKFTSLFLDTLYKQKTQVQEQKYEINKKTERYCFRSIQI